MTDAHDTGLERIREAARRGAPRIQVGLDAATREVVFAYATAEARGDTSTATLPNEVRTFVDAVVGRAVEADVQALQQAGRSDDFIYELAVLAAVAAGSQRGVMGLAALRASRGAAS